MNIACPECFPHEIVSVKLRLFPRNFSNINGLRQFKLIIKLINSTYSTAGLFVDNFLE